MGSISYDSSRIHFEDRLLTHLHIVITQRLRAGESFAMSWIDSVDVGDGRSSIWLHPDGDIYFKFAGSRVPAISQDWLNSLHSSAASGQGLVVTNEDGTLARANEANGSY